jgi:hypothetical protein
MDQINFFEKSENLDQLFAAMAKCQSELEAAHKTAANPFFKSKYADLAEVIGVIKPVAAANDITYMQFPFAKDCLITTIGHKSGQYISVLMSMTPTKNDPQGQGSCLTYMRRYALQSIFGVPAEDDDGNLASIPQNPLSKRPLYTEIEQTKIKESLKEKYKDVNGVQKALGFSWPPSTADEWIKALKISGVKL